MPQNSAHDDAEMILAAYGERVNETFKIFAENLATGQGEQACVLRFRRALDLLRKARDLALLAATQSGAEGEPEQQRSAAAGQAAEGEGLSAEDQAMIEQALSGTTGHMPAAQPAARYRR